MCKVVLVINRKGLKMILSLGLGFVLFITLAFRASHVFNVATREERPATYAANAMGVYFLIALVFAFFFVGTIEYSALV